MKGWTARISSGNITEACEWAQKALKRTASCAGTDREGYKDDQTTSQDFTVQRDKDQRMR